MRRPSKDVSYRSIEIMVARQGAGYVALYHVPGTAGKRGSITPTRDTPDEAVALAKADIDARFTRAQSGQSRAQRAKA
jgi:hypothetical protein